MNKSGSQSVLSVVAADPRGRDVCVSRNKAGALSLELWKRGDQLRLVLWGRKAGAKNNHVLARFYGDDQQDLRRRLQAWFDKHPAIRAQGVAQLSEGVLQ